MLFKGGSGRRFFGLDTIGCCNPCTGHSIYSNGAGSQAPADGKAPAEEGTKSPVEETPKEETVKKQRKKPKKVSFKKSRVAIYSQFPKLKQSQAAAKRQGCCK